MEVYLVLNGRLEMCKIKGKCCPIFGEYMIDLNLCDLD